MMTVTQKFRVPFVLKTYRCRFIVNIAKCAGRHGMKFFALSSNWFLLIRPESLEEDDTVFAQTAAGSR